MKIGIIYGSTMGSTQSMSERIGDTLAKTGHEVSVNNVQNVQPDAMRKYDILLLGCSTWGDGELQEDFIRFEEKMKSTDLAGKKAAVFGPGDTSYPQFCKAVDILEENLAACGAKIMVESLKIDGDVEDQMNTTQGWAENIIKQI
jgi:flavodoxin I